MNYTSLSEQPQRRFGLGSIKGFGSFAKVKSFVKANRKVLTFVALGVFLFYWYEIRPIQINNACGLQASGNARVLLRSKADVATDAAKKASYSSLVQKNMYLRSDYESFYGKCLRAHGIN